MIKMIATDIDGTILPFNSDFSENTKLCINKLEKNGVKVILVTGRMHSSALPLAKELNLKTPIISYQGGLIKDYNGETLFQTNLDESYAKDIIDWARKNDVHINLYINDELYVENDNEMIQSYVKGKFVDYKVCSFDDLELKNINKILALDIYNSERVSQWVEILKEKYPNLYIVKSTPYYCEIGPSNAKKSIGVKFLCKKYGISQDEVLTIGDQNNDIDLVQCGGIGVAMGNATDELKACADFITDTCENDGFVRAVEKFVLI